MSGRDVTVIVPTVGRPSLARLLTALAESAAADTCCRVAEVVVVDDRPRPAGPLVLPAGLPARVIASGGRGPAAARNIGWRAARTEWAAFLDDDVLPTREWSRDLGADLCSHPDAAGIQGRIVVPLPDDRRPTDWERGSAALAEAPWITADMAYRREALEALGGFDERFTRAFREDADLALRALRAGGRLVVGQRRTEHPVRPASRWISVRQQAGNADDELMRRLHGRDWHAAAGIRSGRIRRHVAVTAAGAAAVLAAASRRTAPAALVGLLWAAGTAEFAAVRIRPGPRTRDEVLTMVVTSVAIPPVATGYRLAGAWRHRLRPATRLLLRRSAPWTAQRRRTGGRARPAR